MGVFFYNVRRRMGERTERKPRDTARLIRRRISNFVRSSPDNRLPFFDDYVIFDEPLVKFADGDDPIFSEYKKIISPAHLTPREALAAACRRSGDSFTHVSVISWILPIREEAREANRSEKLVPSRLWSHTRWYGEIFNDRLRMYVAEFISELGYLAAAPAVQNNFKTMRNEQGLYSNWSERHIAYACGQGTFSLSDGLITERGIAHRCGSVVTDLILPESRRKRGSPYANCLFYAGVNCRSCINRCPAGAISERGHDKNRCQQYLKNIGYEPGPGKEYDNEKSVAGCGMCQTRVPCEFQNPLMSNKCSLPRKHVG
jgi:epoxyqueuosine reductase